MATNHTGFTGTGFVDYTNATGGYIEWKVTVDQAGSAPLGIRYANGQASGQSVNRPLAISVNGAAPVTVDSLQVG